MAAGWNFADVWEVAAQQFPDAPAQLHGDRTLSWSEFDRRANGVARWLLDLGLDQQDKVAHYLYNVPEYLESMFGMFKAGMVPVNTNYRYGDEELLYLWNNADVAAVVFHGSFTDRIDRHRSALPNVRGWLWVDDGTGPCPEWATSYEDAAVSGTADAVRSPWGRSGNDLYMLYTGGTTGMPKGVMWRQDDLFVRLSARLGLGDVDADLDLIRAALTQPGPTVLPACPLMHGTGSWASFTGLHAGGCVVTLESRAFDAAELLRAVDRHGVDVLVIVGDAFGKPILRELDAAPGTYDLSSLATIASSGVMWSEETKQGLLRHHDGMLLVDQFGSSEAYGMGSSVSTADGTTTTARFSLGETAFVMTEDGRHVVPGSGEPGMVVVRGRTPIGYYKDPERSARTFPVLDGERCSVPGDWVQVAADGTLTLLGRGSLCINTGGEKVFPEEIEEALKRHAAVRDAVVVGVPDEKWGEVVVAIVECEPGAVLDEFEVIAHVRHDLAGYKAPKRVLTTESIGRAVNGKIDYRRLKAYAAEHS